MTSPETVEFLRSEMEVAANVVVALRSASVFRTDLAPSELLKRVMDATGVTNADLRLAAVRSERLPARRIQPTEQPARPSEPVIPAALLRVDKPAPSWTRFERPRPRLVPAARKAAAESVFASWRVRGNLDCSRCGKPIYSGSDAVIEAAHHADNCCTG